MPPSRSSRFRHVALPLLGLALLVWLAPACSSNECSPSEVPHCEGSTVVSCGAVVQDCFFNCTYRVERSACPTNRSLCTVDEGREPECLAPGLVSSCAASPPLPSGIGRAITVADFNGDGHPDLAGLDGKENAYVVLLGSGDGSFIAKDEVTLPSRATGPGTQFLLAGDFNGDGKVDLASSVGASLVMLVGKGDGTFVLGAETPVRDYFEPIGAADVNADGIADLVGTDLEEPEVFLGGHRGVFAPAVQKERKPYDVDILGLQKNSALADFDEDGKTDVMLGSTSGTSLFAGDGRGGFGPRMTLDARLDPSGAATADFNRDGHADLALVDGTEGTVSIFLGNGDGTFAVSVLDKSPYRAVSIVAGDLDGDGNADAITGDNGDADTLAVRLGHGDGTFGAATIYRVVREEVAPVASLDADGDGRLDVVLLTPSGARVLPNGCQ